MRLKASNPQRASQAVLHAQCSKASNPQRASQAVLHTQCSKASNPQRASQAVLHNLNASRSDTVLVSTTKLKAQKLLIFPESNFTLT